MSDILERLRGYNPPDRTFLEQKKIATDVYDAKCEIERLRAENEHLRRVNSGKPSPELFEAATAELRARVAELEVEAFKLAANHCHHGYGAENGDHRCEYQDRIAELEAQLRTAYGHGSDAGRPPWMKP